VSIELEIKGRIESHDPIRRMLKGAGATCVARALESNHILDSRDGALRRAGCGLRIRSTAPMDGSASKGSLTYKGPRQEGRFKRREELEVEVADPLTMRSIMQALGYREHLVFEKRRETWQMDACKVELDELPLLGKFVEVEGPTEQAIEAVLARLELTGLTTEPHSYVGLLAGLIQEQGTNRREFRFDSPT